MSEKNQSMVIKIEKHENKWKTTQSLNKKHKKQRKTEEAQIKWKTSQTSSCIQITQDTKQNINL